MNKRTIVCLVAALLICAGVGAFAADQSSQFPWAASYNKPGQLNAYLSVGYSGWLSFSPGVEIILGQFDIATIPLSWGIMARGNIGLWYSYIEWSVAPMASLHFGTNFGDGLKFDWYAGLGLDIYGDTYYTSNPVYFGFASCEGVAWMFSDNFALIFEHLYSGWYSSGRIGIEFKL